MKNFMQAVIGSLVLTIFCTSIAMCGQNTLKEVCRVSMKSTQIVYIDDHRVYFPDGNFLKCIGQDGEEKTIYQNPRLSIFMGFGTNLKTIDTDNSIILLTSDDSVIGEIITDEPGQTLISKNDNVIAFINQMEGIFRLYDCSGTLIKEFKSTPNNLAVSDDGNYVFGDAGFIYNISNGTMTYLKSDIGLRYIKAIGNSAFGVGRVGESSEVRGCCVLIDNQGLEKWRTPVFSGIIPTCSIGAKSVVVYLNNQIQSYDITSGKLSWTKSYADQIIKNWQYPIYNSDYVVFQTADCTLHVLDKAGIEIFAKKIEQVKRLIVGGNFIIYQIDKTNDYVVMEIFDEE